MEIKTQMKRGDMNALFVMEGLERCGRMTVRKVESMVPGLSYDSCRNILEKYAKNGVCTDHRDVSPREYSVAPGWQDRLRAYFARRDEIQRATGKRLQAQYPTTELNRRRNAANSQSIEKMLAAVAAARPGVRTAWRGGVPTWP